MSAPLAVKEDKNVPNICQIPWLVLAELFGMEMCVGMKLCRTECRKKLLQQRIICLEVNTEFRDQDRQMHHNDAFW